jgi:putative peptide zinc metalloprotease protein
MRKYLADTVVTVFPFTQHPDGEDVTIANATQSAFLSVPSAAVDILISLAAGKTVGEAQALYELQYGERPDIADFLDVLESEGFVAAKADSHLEAALSPLATGTAAPTLTATPQRYHFESISSDVARRICSRPVLLGCGLLTGLGLALSTLDPSLLPSPSSMVFQHNLTLMSLAVVAFVFFTVFLHEMGHLVAARAAGVPARLGISHRLWYMVAETDMTGIWMVPKRQRYLAFLAGPLIDVVSASALITVLAAGRHGWVTVNTTVTVLCQAWLFTYLVRLLWQCYLFVRTDFYYVIATIFNCKSLMQDTEIFVRNQLARFVPSMRHVDQCAIPPGEMRVIRCYALIWLGGRVVAFATLFLITMPILWGYGVEIGNLLFGGHTTRYELVDVLTLGVVAVAIQGGGLLLWVRSLFMSRR